MKKTVLLFMMTSAFQSFGQNYIPFPDSNAVWVNYHYNYGSSEIPPAPYFPNLEAIDNFCVNGEDTTISSNTYTIIRYCNGPYFGALRDTGGKVYFVPKDSIDELLLYDFTVSAGDTVPNILDEDGDWSVLFVESVDSVLIAGNYRTVVDFGFGYSWIEGIGADKGIFLNPEWIVNISGQVYELNCFSHNDTVFVRYSYPNYYGTGSCEMDYLSEESLSKEIQWTTFPNPTTGEVSISPDKISLPFDMTLTNVLGEKIDLVFTLTDNRIDLDLSALPSGIYQVHLFMNNQYHVQKIVKN